MDDEVSKNKVLHSQQLALDNVLTAGFLYEQKFLKFTLDKLYQMNTRPFVFLLLPVFLMALYYPLGLLFGAPIGNARQLAWAVLSQAAIAWCWAGAVIVVLHSGNIDAVALMFFLSLSLACPSSLLVLAGLFFLESVFASSATIGLVLLAIPAGLLPPLLFNLAAFHATRRKTATRADADIGSYAS